MSMKRIGNERYSRDNSYTASTAMQQIGKVFVVAGIIALIAAAVISGFGSLGLITITPLLRNVRDGLLIGGVAAIVLGLALIFFPMLGMYYMERFKKRIQQQQHDLRKNEIELQKPLPLDLQKTTPIPQLPGGRVNSDSDTVGQFLA